jgi:hypothetical protein
MQYTIKHGNIASIIHVTDTDGNLTDCIYMSKNRQPEAYLNHNMRGEGVEAWEALPLSVRAFVNRQFGTIFALPYGMREQFIKDSVPFTVEVEDPIVEG